MFPWNFSMSAETMLYPWVMKKLCKGFLKKALGKFILGEIDLNQLDVQLSSGTIQLYDLALNVDYINQELGAAEVIVKEGSIGSLLVKLSWKGTGFLIMLDELEIIVAPRVKNVPIVESKTTIPHENTVDLSNHNIGKLEQDRVTSNMLSLAHVHEGVKTVAKMVNQLFSSVNVKISKLIIAFDPCEEKENNNKYCRTLVLRIAEIESKTRISEDAQLQNEPKEDDILGLNQLTHSLEFQGATIEFIRMDGTENRTSDPCPLESSFRECHLGQSQPNSLMQIITGDNGGFSGHINLSIPWKNGSLDICRVDADVHIKPLALRIQPSTVICFIYLWEIFKKKSTGTEVQVVHNLSDSVCGNNRCSQNTSTPGHCLLRSYMVADNGNSSVNYSSLLEEEYERDALISESHVISDWVGRNQTQRICSVPDFGASVDQFFECFDELRSSQSALSNSGMWNWTHSVFSAITAASNLASGSMHVPLEQQHVERTNLKVTLDKISILVSFSDEDPVHSSCSTHDRAKAGSNARYLGVDFCGELLLQICPEQMNFEATVKDVKIDDYFTPKNDIFDCKSHDHQDCIKIQASLISKMQDDVQNALAPFCSSSEHAWLFNLNGDDTESELSLGKKSSIQNVNRKGIYRDDIVKVSLLKTSNNEHCRVTANSKTSDNVFVGPTFTLKLPSFIWWVNLGIVDLMSNVLKQIEIESSEISSRRNDVESSILKHRRVYSQDHEAKGTCSRSTVSTNGSLTGNIFLSNARIIFCFPCNKGADSEGYPFFDQFIALQLSSLTDLGHSNVEASMPTSLLSSRKVNMLPNSTSLHLTLGNLGAYFITSDSMESVAGESHSIRNLKFLAREVLSLRSFSVISMHWHDGAITNPQLINKAKILATAGNLTRSRFKGEDYEFASISTVKDMEDFNTLTRQEIISSSGFLLHARLCPVKVNLEKAQYNSFLLILNQLNDIFSCMPSDPIIQEHPSQGSVLVECDSLEVAISMEIVEIVKGSMQKELPGSWHSFKLKIQNFELLSVSNIGGIKDASFIWVNHQEGSLLGSVTGVPHKEMLLISCSNSTMGRGDGEGSNILSPRFSGSDVVYLLNPEELNSYMSIAVRGGTIVAIGGRLDWWDALSSFFIPPSPEIDQAGDETLLKANSEINRSCRSSFVLNLVDVALSYEPYFYDHVDHNSSPMEPCSAHPNADEKQFFACLLAVSSLKLSSSKLCNSSVGEFNIQTKNLGLLLCPVPRPQVAGGIYDVDHLRYIGYLKIAQGACFGALLRTFSDQDLIWEVESSDSQIALNTCCDTTTGLIQLVAQLQQLFAPDMEDAVVHLQNRWNNVKGENGVNGTFDGTSVPFDAMLENMDTENKSHMGNLLDEICENEFLQDAGDYQDQEFYMSSGDSSLDEPIYSVARNGDDFSGSFTFGESIADLENDEISDQLGEAPELIEDYFLPGLRPLSELSLSYHSSSSLGCKINSLEEPSTRNARWYGDNFQRIRENQVSDKQICVSQRPDAASCSYTESDEYGKIKGRVVLKNMNIVWRMYSGSDWQKFKKPSAGRDATVCLEISLSGMEIQYDIFHDGGICVSRLSLCIRDVFMSDNSKNAPWKLVLGHYQSKDHPRESFSKALKLDLESVRPDPSTPLEEYRLRVALLPIRLHLHQSQLDFLINFFGGASVESSLSDTHDFCKNATEPRNGTNSGGHVITEEALLPYFQKFDIWPVLIRVDYSPSRVDLTALRGGNYAELVNLVPWKGVELQLKHVHAVGIYGWSCICETVIGEWLEDISQTQIHKLLKGLPPIRSLVAVGSGAAKLVALPVQNYRKDRRLLKGIQRGTVAFLRSISLEAIGLGVHLAAGTHDILLHAEYILTGIPPAVSWNSHSRGNINVRSNQPKDARQGIKQACESIGDGLGKSASALVRKPFKRYQRDGGVGSALANAVRAAPVAALAPASSAARAMHCAFLGVRNSLDVEHKKESLEKYLGATQYREFMQ